VSKGKPKRTPEGMARNNEAKRLWRLRNPDKQREYQCRSRTKHREHVLAYYRRYGAKHRERLKARQRARRRAERAPATTKLSMNREFDRWRDRPEEWIARVGRRVRAARLTAGLKQTDLANASGLFQSQISRIEGGRINATRRNLQKIADALSVSLGQLIPDRLNHPSP
jgi:ribosome-binding protein aMBF1 (putative translation factor)